MSCIIFYILAIGLPLGRGGKTGMLVLLSFLACIEKLCSIMNLVSVEKDWVSSPQHQRPRILAHGIGRSSL